MKKIVLLVSLGCITITACLIWLVKNGVSLSPEILISPSEYHNDDQVVRATVQRLFPQLNEDHQWRLYVETSGNDIKEKLNSLIRQTYPQVHIENINAFLLDAPLKPYGPSMLYVGYFKRSEFNLSEACSHSHRLDFSCVVEVSLHRARRKMKDPTKRYYLLTDYMQKYFFLLIQEP